ncbi:DUF2189 domain-containing protein [Phenylobacterium sp. SCN 70-31]|uniref:DUF2189 domain-containing protein n=1 Tax=Phenylobacterium sp. SCN 70-31 TaxID=1660129 RepID=UPI000ABC192D|nr:DUF2189 domain-containing protein [Phenylobacterium sp. SCN 70-31]
MSDQVLTPHKARLASTLRSSWTSHSAERPVIRKIAPQDLVKALTAGFGDFMENPSHVLFLSLIYPIVGLLLAFAAAKQNMAPLLLALSTGFALVGPLAALGLYELSRRRELGLSSTWRDALGVIRSPSLAAIFLLSLMLVALFVSWLLTAGGLMYLFHPTTSGSLPDVATLLTTHAGWRFLAVGTAVGFVYALVALTISVVSLPLLLDRNVGVGLAVSTSIRAVLANPLTMALWGLIVALALAAGSLLLFVGLAVVMPVLGHVTWRLYRLTVAA